MEENRELPPRIPRSIEERSRIEAVKNKLVIFLRVLRMIGKLKGEIMKTEVEIMNMQSGGATQEQLDEAWRKLDDLERSLQASRKAFQLYASAEGIYGKDQEFRNLVNMVHRALFLELRKRWLEDKLSFYSQRLNEVRESILSQKGDTEYLLKEFERFAKIIGVCENELKSVDDELKEPLYSYENLGKYTGLPGEIYKVVNEIYPYCAWGRGIFLPDELIDYKE
jgi:chromosome segregation ATPase